MLLMDDEPVENKELQKEVEPVEETSKEQDDYWSSYQEFLVNLA